MAAANREVIGYTVTLELFVPEEVARREVDRLDASWRTESWTPEAAAFEIIRESLATAGLHDPVRLGVREVVS